MKPPYCTDQDGNCDHERCYCEDIARESTRVSDFDQPIDVSDEMKPRPKNVLEQVDEIIYKNRDDRNYGSFSESMEKTAALASLMTGKEITAVDVYKILIAMKMTREENAHKDDNIVDAIGYLAGLYDYYNERKPGKL